MKNTSQSKARSTLTKFFQYRKKKMEENKKIIATGKEMLKKLP